MKKLFKLGLLAVIICLGICVVPTQASQAMEDACLAYYKLIQETMDDVGKEPRNKVIWGSDEHLNSAFLSSIDSVKLFDWNADGIPELYMKTSYKGSQGTAYSGGGTVLCLLAWDGSAIKCIADDYDASKSSIDLCYDKNGMFYYMYENKGFDKGISVKGIEGYSPLAPIESVFIDKESDTGSSTNHNVYKHTSKQGTEEITEDKYIEIYNSIRSYTPYILILSGPESVQSTLKELSEYTDPSYLTHYYTPSSWAKADVDKAVIAGYVPDVLLEKYTQPITRAEFCALAVKYFETVSHRTIEKRAEFSDTDDINVQKMGGMGIISGYGDGRFGPEDKLTREQAAVILANFAEIALKNPMQKSLPGFSDQADISSWATTQVGQVAKSGIMNGVGNNKFDPKGYYTREQSILTMLRMDSCCVPISSIVISNTPNTVDKGYTGKLTAKVLPENATDPRIVDWVSSNTNVITVDNDGTVKAVGQGVAKVTVRAQDGTTASVSFNVTVGDKLDLQTNAPVKTSFLYVNDSHLSSYVPDDDRIAGTLEINSADWTEKGNVNAIHNIVVSGRVTSLSDDLDGIVPYFHYALKDDHGTVVKTQYVYLDKNMSVGDEFEEAITIPNGTVVFGDTYSIEFISEEGKTQAQRQSEAPKILLPDLPFDVPDTAYNNMSWGTVCIENVNVDLEYKSRYDKYNVQFIISGNISLEEAEFFVIQHFEFSWYLVDSQGNQFGLVQREYFFTPTEGPFSKKLTTVHDLKQGETYQLVFELK